MSDLKDLLGKGSIVEFGGQEWHVCPLTFNDLCDLEDRFGDVGSIDLTKASTQRTLLWLALRTHEDRSRRFADEHELGGMLPLNDPQKTAAFVSEVFRICGLIGGNALEAEVEKKQERKPRRTVTNPSLSEIYGS